MPSSSSSSCCTLLKHLLYSQPSFNVPRECVPFSSERTDEVSQARGRINTPFTQPLPSLPSLPSNIKDERDERDHEEVTEMRAMKPPHITRVSLTTAWLPQSTTETRRCVITSSSHTALRIRVFQTHPLSSPSTAALHFPLPFPE